MDSGIHIPSFGVYLYKNPRIMFKPMQKRKSYCGTKHKLLKPKPRLPKLRDLKSLQPIPLPEHRIIKTSFLQPHTSST